MRLNPKLAQCTQMSILGALFQAAQLGLEPNIEGQAYLIPYNNSKQVIDTETGKKRWVKQYECQFQIGYKDKILSNANNINNNSKKLLKKIDEEHVLEARKILNTANDLLGLKDRYRC